MNYCNKQQESDLVFVIVDWVVANNVFLLRYIKYVFSHLPPPNSISTIMRASNFWWSSPLFFFIFRLSLAASIFVPEGLVYRDDSLISSDFEDEIHYFDNLNPDLTLLSKSDRCADNDATKSPRKRQSNPAWCTTDGKTPPQQLSSPTKGQGQDRNGWTDNKPFEGELPSQLRFLDDDPHSKAEPKPNIELCKDRGIFAVCAEDKSVGWWGQPDSMQFKLDPCTPCKFCASIHSIGPVWH